MLPSNPRLERTGARPGRFGRNAAALAAQPQTRRARYCSVSHGKDSQLPQGVLQARAVRTRRSSDNIEATGNAVVGVAGRRIVARTSPEGIFDTCRTTSGAVWVVSRLPVIRTVAGIQ